MLTQRSANPRLQFDELKVAAHQFQSAVGSELLVTELDRKLLLDRLPQPPYLQPHLWGLRVVPSCVTAALQMTRQRPLFFDQIVESTRIIFGSRLGNSSSESHKAMEGESTDVAEPRASKSTLVPLSRMVRIVWTDSCSRSGWTTPGAAREWSTAVLTVQSVGFIFSDEPDSMVLAQSFDSNQEPNPNGMLQIPRSAILSIREVNANAGVHS